jgi:hypothetical protein
MFTYIDTYIFIQYTHTHIHTQYTHTHTHTYIDRYTHHEPPDDGCCMVWVLGVTSSYVVLHHHT